MKDSKLKTAGMRKLHWGKAVVSIVVTLAAMPLTHSLARVLKEGTTGVEQFYAGMGMGAFGLFMVIAGVFVKGHIRQTLLGLFGGMFYWMGAVDFLFMYFANRFGTQAQLDPVTGEVVSRPEYLLLPATFGFWVMVMILYLFCTRNGCNFLNWWQKLFFGKHKKEIVVRAMTRHTSIVAFMEVITMPSGDTIGGNVGTYRFDFYVCQIAASCLVGYEFTVRLCHRHYFLDSGRGV